MEGGQTGQDEQYQLAIAGYGPALDRLARACEADHDLRRDLLQDHAPGRDLVFDHVVIILCSAIVALVLIIVWLLNLLGVARLQKRLDEFDRLQRG
jgi:hypothetical protein